MAAELREPLIAPSSSAEHGMRSHRSVPPPLDTMAGSYRVDDRRRRSTRDNLQSQANGVRTHLRKSIGSINIVNTPTIRGAKESMEETWYELFFDLIYVGAALKFGSLVKYDFVHALLLFLALRTTWDLLTVYQNRWHSGDVLHTCYYILHTLFTVFATLHLTHLDGGGWDAHTNQAPFAYGIGLSRLLLLVQVRTGARLCVAPCVPFYLIDTVTRAPSLIRPLPPRPALLHPARQYHVLSHSARLRQQYKTFIRQKQFLFAAR
jgi:hypothetical protein